MTRVWAGLAAGFLLLTPPVLAQTPPAAAARSPILTIDQDRLFAGSAWGRRATSRLTEESTRLAAENRALEAQLMAEEKSLTDARKAMDPEAFRKAADEFDIRVVELRRRQDTKGRAIARISEVEREAFFKASIPVIGDVLRRRGAVVVLDSRAIFVAVDSIDVTDEMIRAIDLAIGAGSDAPDPAPEPADPPVDGGAN